jgi:peptide/nickel transport system permease protein
MIRYFLRRAGRAVFLLVAVSLLLFLLLQAAPGEFLSDMRLNPQISEQTLAVLRAEYGLDQPLPSRYLHWLHSVARGEMGYSFAYNLPASELLWPRAYNTLLLTIPALILSWLLAIPLGVVAAWSRSQWTDRLFSAGTSMLLAIPDLLLALLLLLLVLRTGWFPAGGSGSSPGSVRFSDLIWHMMLPVAALTIGALPVILRHVRAAMIEALDSPFVRAAQAHGVTTLRILFIHGLRAAANPLISLFGLSIAGLLSTSLLIEVVMSWPGMGPMLVEAIISRDLFLVIGAVMLSTFFLVIGNFLADLLLYAADPRIRLQ